MSKKSKKRRKHGVPEQDPPKRAYTPSEASKKASAENGKNGGTKSPEISCQNSLGHAITVGTFYCLPGENEAQFDRRHQYFIAEHQPEGFLEYDLVKKMVEEDWLLERARRRENMLNDPECHPSQVDMETSLNRNALYVSRINRRLTLLEGKLKHLQTARGKTGRSARVPLEVFARDEARPLLDARGPVTDISLPYSPIPRQALFGQINRLKDLLDQTQRYDVRYLVSHNGASRSVQIPGFDEYRLMPLKAFFEMNREHHELNALKKQLREAADAATEEEPSPLAGEELLLTSDARSESYSSGEGANDGAHNDSPEPSPQAEITPNSGSFFHPPNPGAQDGENTPPTTPDWDENPADFPENPPQDHRKPA